MQAKAHLFFPENDLALSRNIANYTPPKAGVEMRLSGEMLPMWYGKKGDSVICQGVNGFWFDMMSETFEPGVEVFSGLTTGYSACPWGWSKASRRFFENVGFDPCSLPDDCELERIRQLSHRHSSRWLMEKLSGVLDFDIAECPVEVRELSSAGDMIKRYGNVMVKTPWSNSGRGVFPTQMLDKRVIDEKIESLIKAHGSVMMEPYYNRVADFAMLFYNEIGKGVEFKGYSLFEVDGRGSYQSNILLSDEDIEDTLGQWISPEQLHKVRKALEDALTRLIADAYYGPLGVDMLVADKGGGEYLLDPVVELNLRNTMGYVAHEFGRRFVAKGRKGRFRVLPADVSRRNEQSLDKAVIENGKIYSGEMCLNPAGGFFDFKVELA